MTVVYSAYIDNYILCNTITSAFSDLRSDFEPDYLFLLLETDVQAALRYSEGQTSK